MYYIRNLQNDWLRPTANWYRGLPTFTNQRALAGQFTEAEADAHLLNPRMHAGAYKETVPT